MVNYNFKEIRPVPTSKDFIDIVLSKTQRKTPTVVHAGYKISRIRAFYMRKVRFAGEAFMEKLSWILNDFPVIDDLHPFFADLLSVLYDRDHLKLALGQLNVAKNLIGGIQSDYVRLLKYGDTLYRCKQLKRAALGRMCTLMKKHKSCLGYLEEVRKHLMRLPSINPQERTLLCCGYPNVGKSSYVNKVSRADVEVQPYAFTTKSLYVGHFDFKYLRFQVIDTPGILDKPLQERNTIEMQAITALAHLQSTILYFVDLSEQCGWSLEQQIALFENIKPLFSNKPLLIVANKIDVAPLESLEPNQRTMLDKMVKEANAELLTMSALAEMNISEVKQKACELLLEKRVETKTKSNKLNGILNRLTVTVPQPRDNKKREPCIPEAVLKRRMAKENGDEEEDEDTDMKEPRKLQRDIQWEHGGPGVYNPDYREQYLLKHPEERFDTIPWIVDGKNIADFVDPDIEAKLEELEKEEEERAARELAELEAYENADESMDEEEKQLIRKIRAKKKVVIQDHRNKKNKNRGVIGRSKLPTRTKSEAVKELEDLGVDATKVKQKGVETRRGRKRERSREPRRSQSVGDAEGSGKSVERRSKSRGRSLTPGLKPSLEKEAEKRRRLSQKSLRGTGKAGVADRRIHTKMPKHLFSGKRGMGKTQRR